jgi:hypothetical protein
MTTKKVSTRADLVRQIRSTRDLEERLRLQKLLDDNRSPLLTSLQAMEDTHGRKAVEGAIEQWEQHEKDGPLGPGGVEPDGERLSPKERALAPPPVPVGSQAWDNWVEEHKNHPAAKSYLAQQKAAK